MGDNILKLKLIVATFLIFFVLGCHTTNIDLSESSQTSYDAYVTMSINKTGDNNNINAILKVFSSSLLSDQPISWQATKTRKNNYIAALSLVNISSNYPVMASSCEINLVNGFWENLISYGVKNKSDASPSDIAGYLCSESVVFIIKINNYEYDKKIYK